MSTGTCQELEAILTKANRWNIDIQTLPAIKNRPQLQLSYKKYISCIIVGMLFTMAIWNYRLFNSDGCLIEMPQQIAMAFRPTENCDFCRNVTEVQRVSNILPTEFEDRFAYNAVPVIVTDATVNWSALDVFDYWYFQRVYETAYDDSERTNCQFFPVRWNFSFASFEMEFLIVILLCDEINTIFHLFSIISFAHSTKPNSKH